MISDLERRRDAREYWVSRGHLHAGLVASALLAFVSFGMGFLLGQSRVGAAVVPPERALLARVPGEDLVALLAEVERGTLKSASSAIVYPQLIEGVGPPAVPTVLTPGVGVDAVVGLPPRPAELQPDPVPPGVYTVQAGAFGSAEDALRLRDHLNGQQVPAWLSVEHVDGVPAYRVAIGGFASMIEAEAALGVVAPIVRTGPVTVGAPEVVAIERGGPIPTEETDDANGAPEVPSPPTGTPSP